MAGAALEKRNCLPSLTGFRLFDLLYPVGSAFNPGEKCCQALAEAKAALGETHPN
jgi:hypothetical protein